MQLLNIADVQIWAASLNRQPSVDSDDGSTNGVFIKSILCMPILNGKKDVIGVAQLINKVRYDNNCVRDHKKEETKKSTEICALLDIRDA